jgi:uncharacterized protein YqcC (DUF446 family)
VSAIHDRALAKAEQIEAELRRLGWWKPDPLAPRFYQFTRPFAADTMPFAWWLQFILLPRVREIVEDGGAFPSSSSVGAHAVREFDGVPEADRLVALLSEFDRLVEETG